MKRRHSDIETSAQGAMGLGVIFGVWLVPFTRWLSDTVNPLPSWLSPEAFVTAVGVMALIWSFLLAVLHGLSKRSDEPEARS